MKNCSLEDGTISRCVLEVSLQDIRNNYSVIRNLTAGKLIAVVKNNGYGLGLVPYGRLLAEWGADMLAVATAEEGIILRENGVGVDILVMTPPEDEETVQKTAEHSLIATVGSLREVSFMAAWQKPCRVHIKLDTGFGRFGLMPGEAETAARMITQYPQISVEGVYTHCGAVRPDRVMKQYESFEREADRLCAVLGKRLMRHFAHSSLLMRYPAVCADAVRVGSALLGRIPGGDALGLRPVGLLRAQVRDIRLMPAGSCPGYGEARRLRHECRIALVAAGWQDGFGLERRREVLCMREVISGVCRIFTDKLKGRFVYHKGKAIPVLGHGGMNFTLLDAADCELSAGDWVEMRVNPLMVPNHVPRRYRDAENI